VSGNGDGDSDGKGRQEWTIDELAIFLLEMLPHFAPSDELATCWRC
jgi:hypothetical protein